MFYANMASSDEEGEEPEQEQAEARCLVQRGCERHAAGEDLDLLPVAPNMEAGGSHLAN